jgi:RNA polymerase sigma-70 factor (ECF subfamily)
VFRQLSSFKEESSFSTWLYRIATNTALSAARKKKHDTINIEDNAYGDIPDELLDEALDNDSEEQLQRLSEAIDRLDAEERALITLYYMNERPIEEVATIMGLTQSNVKTKLYRTRKKLYLLLNDRKL